MTFHKTLAALFVAAGLAACGDATDETASAPTAPTLDPATVEYFEAEVGDRVFFDFDKSNLLPAAQATLRAQAAWLKEYAAGPITIEGHADERGTREYNLALGARRAASVKAFLIGEGLEADMINTVSYGKERPVALCSQESCWSKNRRGVTVVAAPTS